MATVRGLVLIESIVFKISSVSVVLLIDDSVCSLAVFVLVVWLLLVELIMPIRVELSLEFSELLSVFWLTPSFWILMDSFPIFWLIMGALISSSTLIFSSTFWARLALLSAFCSISPVFIFSRFWLICWRWMLIDL